MITFKEYLNESSMTFKQRMQRGRVMKRMQPEMKRKRRLAAKRKASPDKLLLRAERTAKEIIRNQIAGKTYQTLSDIKKQIVDRKVEMKKTKIKILARKLLPQIKEKENERIKKVREKLAATAAK